MHTTYISNEMGGSQATGMSEKQTKTLKDAETAEPERDDRESQIANIQVRQESVSVRPEAPVRRIADGATALHSVKTFFTAI